MATIQELEKRLNALEKAFLQSQKNQVPVTAKVDDTANKVEVITPYTATKTAYYGDTSVTFYDVPQGKVSVYVDDFLMDYSVSRIEDRLVVSFEPLDKASTQITISIQ